MGLLLSRPANKGENQPLTKLKPLISSNTTVTSKKVKICTRLLFFLLKFMWLTWNDLLTNELRILLSIARRSVTTGGSIPLALNHYGRRKVPTMSQVLLQYSTFVFEKTHVRTWGHHNCFLPRAPPYRVMPLIARFANHAKFVFPW